jgi:hypothetical protein
MIRSLLMDEFGKRIPERRNSTKAQRLGDA